MQVLQFTPWTNYPIQIIKSAVPHDKIMACGLIPNTNSQQWIQPIHLSTPLNPSVPLS